MLSSTEVVSAASPAVPGQPSAEQLQLPTGEISLVHSAQRAKGKVLVVDKDRILRRTPHRSGGCLLHKGIGICGGQVVTASCQAP